ncbi:hypothetical protein ACFQ36_11105 [Arthrobacter sp. GCM10027362]|uniref:hypothetical protein n=1 Tax=Arthrobacter sp. GCM10027362 TaxID=3273379 RepID=UPI00362D706B
MRTMSGTRPHTLTWRIIAAMAAAVGWICLSLVPAAPAMAESAAATLRNDVGCEAGGTVKAYPPVNVTSSAREDIAYWKPTLAVWDGTQWVEYSKPGAYPAYADILPGGINKGVNGGWRSSTTHGQLLFFPFRGLPAGVYAVYHEVVLQEDGTVLTGWSSDTCTLY